MLAVVADPPFAVPGATVAFDMLAVSQAGVPLEVAWFAGCENPPGDQAERCLDTLDTTIVLGDTHFETTISADIISRRPPTPGATPKYGTAYVYFAVCAGTLVNQERLGFGVDCVDRDSGQPLGAASFVVGYTPIFAYDDVANTNPLIADVSVPDSVPACTAADVDDCPDIDVLVAVDPSQSEPDYSAVAVGDSPVGELLWATFFTTSGEFVADTRLIADGDDFRPLDDSKGTWHVEPGYTGPVTIYVVLRDNRGGSSWTRREVTVTAD
ncbi:MAG TPA: hypothetical protein VLC93_12380 [Myxococcota bacterium]|nr:hypothetical protein [Myxococcota bacterium]